MAPPPNELWGLAGRSLREPCVARTDLAEVRNIPDCLPPGLMFHDGSHSGLSQ
jgi:hypothetical protein